MTSPDLPPLNPRLLPPGIRARFIDGVNGLRVHVLEAGDAAPDRPCVLLLHGFPELAYSWRKVMPALAAAGYHAVAPDLRGYGRSAPGPIEYDADLAPFCMHNRLLDALALVAALGRTQVALVGHDFGAWIAAFCALARPDVFRSLVLMSAPFGGAPDFVTLPASLRPPADDPIHAALAALLRPRKHYHRYYATRPAAPEMDRCPEGIARFLRAYFHHKSADWPGNHPHRLAGWTAEALAQMPTYYIMDLEQSMPETVAPELPADGGAGCTWLTEAELGLYTAEYERTGFQGGLQGYRCRMEGSVARDFALFAGRQVTVPVLFVAGRSDWGTYQAPGALERMQSTACPALRGCHLIEGAGHWVQQEQPQAVNSLLLDFLRETAPAHSGAVSGAVQTS